MADHQHRVRIAREEGLQPDRALEVEVVGRLVEQEHVGPANSRGQRHPHPPAAGELGAGPPCAAASNPSPFRIDAARASAECASMSASRSGSRRSGARPALLGLGEQRRALDVGRQHRVDQAVAARRRLLRHPADPRPPRHLDLAARRAAARRGSAGTAWSCRCRSARRIRPCARPGSAPRHPRRAACPRSRSRCS